MSDVAEIPDKIAENPVVGCGISSWVVRVDAVAKCYLSREGESRERELAVYKRLVLEYGEPHECIVPFYGVLDGCLLLQFQANGSVRQHRARVRGEIPLDLRLRWAEQIARGLAFVHSKDILHGDLSCNNIFIGADLNARIGDFAGSSIDGLPFLTVYETSQSLPGDTSISVRRDVFALGSTLYELMTGLTPFQGEDACEIEKRFGQGQFPSLGDVSVVGGIILQCWKGQYDTVNEVLEDIHQARLAASTVPKNSLASSFTIATPLVLAAATLLLSIWWPGRRL